MYKLILFVLLLLLPGISFAFTYNLYEPLDSAENNFLFSWGPFGSPLNYDCNLTDYICLQTNQKSFPANPDMSLITEAEWYNQGKTLVVYKIFQKTSSETAIRYYIASYAQNQWSTGRQLFINDDLTKIYWPGNNQNEFVYITSKYTQGNRDFVRFNFAENKEVARKSVMDTVTNGTVSPDGLWIAYYAPLSHGKKSTVLLRLVSPGETYRFDYGVPKNWELLTDANRLLAFSANSSYFAFLDDSTTFSVARIVKLDNNQIFLNMAEVIGKDIIGTAEDILFPDNENLLIIGNDKKSTLDWNLYSYDIATTHATSVITNVSYKYPMRGAGKLTLLAKMDGPNMVPVLYDQVTKKYHEFNLEKSTASPAISREVIALKSGFNGVIIKNKNIKITAKTPLVVWLHGGPYRQTAKEYHSYPSYAVYDWVLDQLVLQGAVVFKVDSTGSYGYGNTAAYDLVGKVGKADVADVYNSVKEINKKLKLKGSIYLMGNSSGGYLAPRTLVAYPQDFTGAIAINGVFEWRTLLNYLGTSLFNTHFGGLYDPNNNSLYSQASITSRIKRLSSKQKVVIIHGMADTTINPDQSYTFYDLLKDMGKNAKLVSIPGEDHVFKKASSLETICKVSSETLGFKVTGEICQFK